MKKKTEADELALQMTTLPFGAALKVELEKYLEIFGCSAHLLTKTVKVTFVLRCFHSRGLIRSIFSDISKLVAKETNDESAYIPCVRRYIDAMADFEKPQKAASNMVKSLNSKRKATPPAKKAKAAKTTS